jgi:hypothetical protein
MRFCRKWLYVVSFDGRLTGSHSTHSISTNIATRAQQPSGAARCFRAAYFMQPEWLLLRHKSARWRWHIRSRSLRNQDVDDGILLNIVQTSVNLFENALDRKTPVVVFAQPTMRLNFPWTAKSKPEPCQQHSTRTTDFGARYCLLGAVHCRPGLKSLENDMKYGVTVSRCDIEVRRGFLRKVYGILAAQLILTTMVGATFMNVAVIKVGFGNNMHQEWILHSSSCH